MDFTRIVSLAQSIAPICRDFGAPLIVNDGYDFATGTKAVKDGVADAVAYGKTYIANPDLVERFRTRAPMNAIDPDSLYDGDAHGYTDYPALFQRGTAPVT